MSILGIDIGASTIDLALLDRTVLRTAKLPRVSMMADRSVAAALEHATREWSCPPTLIGEIRIGSTGALNMLLQRRVAPVGLIATRGFADTLALGRQNRADLYDPVARSPSPQFLVASGAVHEISGRMGAEGEELEPLAPEQVLAAGEALHRQGVQAIAVCLLFAHLNPAHELACAQALARGAPGVPVVLSHRVDGNAREYERTVSTCLEASLVPGQLEAIDMIETALRGQGFAGRLSFADSRGHLLSCGDAKRCVTTQIIGGPAAAAQQALGLMKQAGLAKALAIDAGSTSTDIVALGPEGPAVTSHGVVAGVPLRIAMADMESIVMGGGARLKSLHPHPEFTMDGSPGEPDVTDALVALGEMPADLAAGYDERIARAADEAGLPMTALAQAIRDAAADRIAEAVVRYAASRNIDPAGMPLIAAGGLGQILAASVASRTGTREMILGRHCAVAGAVGLLHARHVREAVRTVGRPLAALTDGELAGILEELEETGAAPAQSRIVLTVAPNAFMHRVSLQLDMARPVVADLRAAFDAYHVGRFGSPSHEPGFVFSIGWQGFDPAPDMAAPAETGTGRIMAPEGWKLCEGKGFVCLRRQHAIAGLRPETLQMRLNAIAQSMQEMLFRTAVSPVVREGNDAAAALLSPDGELIALSDAIPLLLGALDGSARAILERFPREAMQEGDLYLMNDPFLGGTHLPDLTVIRPVFHDGMLIALAASILHHQDIGGMRAGSVPPDAVDIFQEGLRLPPVLMGREGRIGQHIVDLIHANSRAPATVLGDIASQVGAGAQAAASLRALVDELGADAFATAVAQCLERGETLARSSIAAMAAGPHHAAEQLDPMPGLPPVRIELSLSCTEGRFRADFTGTSPQVAAPVNCVRSGPFAAAFYSLLSAMGQTVFRNGGVVRCLDLSLPAGCAINASPPAAVNARMGVVRATTSTLLQALAKALPDRMPAANSGMSYVLAFFGAASGGGRFIATEIIAGGAGGGPDADGAAGLSTDVGNAMNMPAEALESQIPVRLLSAEIRRGSGGEGRYRGGDGIRRTYLALCDDIQVSLRGERFRNVPEGLLGGGSPQPAAARVLRHDGSVEHLATRSTPVLNEGDRLIVESCGGAGYGVKGEAM